MPQVFKIGSYWVYFWANENKPLEPVHVPKQIRILSLKNGCLSSERLPTIADNKSVMNTRTIKQGISQRDVPCFIFCLFGKLLSSCNLHKRMV